MKREGIVGEIKGKREIERGRERGKRGRRMKGIVMMIVMGCNSGGVKGGEGTGGEEGRGGSLSEVLLEVGRSAENVFYSFVALISDTLGFNATKDTKKQDVGEYFDNLSVKIGSASKELEDVVKKAEGEGSKDGSIAVAIREAVNVAKTTLNTLKEHLESLKDIGDGAVVGDAASNKEGVAADGDALNKVLKAFQGIIIW